MREVHALEARVVVELLKGRHSSTTVELRAAATLFVTVVLAEMGRE